MAKNQDNGQRRLTPKQRAAKKRKNIIIFVIELMVLAIVVVAAWLVIKFTGTEHTNLTVGSRGDNQSGDKVDVTINDTVYQEIESGSSEQSGYTQIALFGVDSRDDELDKGTRTDTIIIACINNSTKEVKLVSVYRDTYLNLANDKYNKCNSAYVSGGAAQAINMLNLNMDLAITDYVTIGFNGLIDVIDALGGIYIDVKQDEIKHLNNYQVSMVGTTTDGKNFYAESGVDYIPVTTSGYQKLNGLQATAYCRIRYVGNDYGRTERQRNVIAATMEAAKGMNVNSLTKIANTIFDEVATSLDLTKILDVLGSLTSYTIVESSGFPSMDMLTTGTIGGKGSCIVPLNLSSNVTWIHEVLFGTVDYVPSGDVEACSDKIHSDTAPYLN